MVLFTLFSVPENSYPVGSCMARETLARRGGGRGWGEEGVYSLIWPNIRVLKQLSPM